VSRVGSAGTVEGRPIQLNSALSVVPVLGWRSVASELGATIVESAFLGVLVASPRGVNWTGTGVSRGAYPDAEASAQPPLPVADLVRMSIEVERDTGVLIIKAVAGEETPGDSAPPSTPIVRCIQSGPGIRVDEAGTVEPL
jgi:hypothetical protein